MQQTEQLLTAIERYLAGKATAAQRQMVNDWYLSFDDELVTVQTEDADYERLLDARLRIRIAESTGNMVLNPEKVKTIRLWPKIAVAAAAIAAIVFGVWFFNASRQSRLDVGNRGSAQYATDIAPGKNGATITLSNGKVIQLSDAKSGVVIGKGRIAYSSSPDNIGTPIHDEVASIPRNDVMQLTASTARGQTYQFTLPDGTKVWLNADSKLEFPSSFVNSKTRFVKLSGEGYFEVEKDKAHPFIVGTDKQEVEVLGTHFNVTAYSDEGSTKTTLLEGSVAVTSYTPRSKRPGERADVFSGTVLAPNQQSILTGSNRLNIKEVDASLAVAWKDGSFRFKSETVAEIMRKVQRWYDVQVVYTDQSLGDIKFSGTISRYENVSKLLDILQTTQRLQFKIEGRKVYVSE